MNALIAILALTVLLFLLQAALRRVGPLGWAVVFFVVPLALTAYWVQVNDFGPFPWIKFYTVFVSVCFGTAMCYTALGNQSWARSAITVFLALNILEATALDCIAGGLAHTLNAVAGFALLAALPRNLDTARVAGSGRVRDLRYHGISRQWIVGYTLWNWAFVYLNYPEFVGLHTAVLLSALVVGMANARRWLQARACILGASFIGHLSFPWLVRSQLDTTNWSHPAVGICAALAALVVTGCELRHHLSPTTLAPAMA